MELQALETAVLAPKGLKGSAKIVYDLLKNKFEKKEVLQFKELFDVYIDTMVPNYREHIIGTWPKGKYVPIKVNSNRWYKENWETTSKKGEAIQWLKYHIGNLVLNGYMVAIPVINFDVNSTKKIDAP